MRGPQIPLAVIALPKGVRGERWGKRPGSLFTFFSIATVTGFAPELQVLGKELWCSSTGWEWGWEWGGGLPSR